MPGRKTDQGSHTAFKLYWMCSVPPSPSSWLKVVFWFVSFGLQGGTPMAHPEDELERLTKKMLFDMDNPPSEEYFGKKLLLFIPVRLHSHWSTTSSWPNYSKSEQPLVWRHWWCYTQLYTFLCFLHHEILSCTLPTLYTSTLLWIS